MTAMGESDSQAAPASRLPPLLGASLLLNGVLAVLLLKLGAAALPYYWDEQAYIVPSHWLAQESLVRALPGLHPEGKFFGHPPGLYVLMALQFRAFGETVLVPHLLMLAFACACLAGTYRLGAHLGDRTTGVAAAAFVFAIPIFFAQSVMVLGDVPVAALGVLAVGCLLERRFKAYVALALAMLAFKETSLAVVVACAAYAGLREPGRGRAERLRDAGRHLAPALLLLAFLAAVRVATGTTVSNLYFQEHSLITFSADKLRSTTGWMFVEQGKWILTALVLAALVVQRGRFWRPELGLFAAILALFWAAFGLLYFLPRYFVPTYPYLAVTAALALRALLGSSAPLRLGAAAAVAVALVTRYDCTKSYYRSNLEADPCYVDAVRLDQEVIRFLASGADVTTAAVPWTYMKNVELPFMGYVREPGAIRALQLEKADADAEFDLLVLAPSSASAPDLAAARRIIDERGLVVVRRFERGGTYVELYGRARPE